MPFRAFCSFLPRVVVSWYAPVCDVSMPFRAFCSFLLVGRGVAKGKAESRLNALPGILFFSLVARDGITPTVAVSMPFRAFCSFLPTRCTWTTCEHSSEAISRVSMPFRAFCSFLLESILLLGKSGKRSQCPSGHFVLFYDSVDAKRQ